VTGVIISFIIIVLVIQLVFQQQTAVTFESAFESVARDISTGIDRTAAAAGSIFIEQAVPKGLKFNLTVDYKTVLVSYGSDKAVRKSTVGLTYTSPRTFTNPTSLCIIKTANDRRVYVDEGSCKCNLNDDVCDPVCSVKGICDAACRNSVPDDVCNPYCVRSGDTICDPDCYRNITDQVYDSDCITAENNPDGICDPDSNNVNDKKCDKDCYFTYSNGNTGVCDPDCPPNDQIIEEGGVKYKQRDGYCYTGCVNKTTQSIAKKYPSPLNRPCETTPYPSGTAFYRDAQCSDNVLWVCGRDLFTCPSCFQPCIINDPAVQAIGLKENDYNACCSHIGNQTVNIVHPTDRVCCCEFNSGTCEIDSRGSCIENGKFAFPEDSTYCKQTTTVTTTAKIKLLKDGVCDLDCKDSADICDPDCPDAPACQNQCTKAGERADVFPCCEGLIAAPGDNICRDAGNPLAACGNGICEGRPGTPNGWGPGNKTRWETSYTCSADCPPAAQRPSCGPAGPFVSSVCYRDITNQDGTRAGDRPSWSGNAIAICSEDVLKFLDRRNWDINEVFKSVVLPPPEGYAFDASRYVNACDRVQNAGLTTAANENYSSEARICCSLDGTGCPFPEAEFLGKQCEGVGYCADHAASMLSILRSLGVPDNLVFMTFDIQGQNCGRHAWVVMKCDTSLKSNPKLWPEICSSNEDKWISIDATRHFVAPLSQTPCVSLGIFWNDKGIYPLTYGKLPDGPNGEKRGYVIPPDAKCNTYGEPTEAECKNNFGVEHHYDDLCKPYNVECIVP